MFCFLTPQTEEYGILGERLPKKGGGGREVFYAFTYGMLSALTR
jgi:hypothetical protein